MRIKAHFSSLSVLLAMLILSSCSKTSDYKSFLGKVDYSCPVAGLVFERIEGESDAYGIVYREVSDFNALTLQDEIPVCLYFYSSLPQGAQSLTAGVEDLAQTLEGRLLFICIDGMEADAVSSAYDVSSYPEFILIDKGVRISVFDGTSYDSWSITDVAEWVTDNGFAPDYSKLED